MGRTSSFSEIISIGRNVLLDLLYPPTCFHCKVVLPKKGHFCEECLQNLSLLPAEGHCTKCFAEIPKISGTCKPCREIRSPFRKLGACFDSIGPGKTLLHLFQQNLSDSYAKDLASYLVVQIDQLHFPLFEIITAIPGYFSSPFAKVAKEVGRMLGGAYLPLLKRQMTPRPQFSLKKKCNIIHKKVLLLSSEMQDRTEIWTAGWAIQEGLPEILYGMTFCATLS